MSNLLKDLGVGTIITGFILVRLHYIALFFVFIRFVFANGFPDTFDKFLIFYIIAGFVYRYYLIKRQSIIIKRLMKLRSESINEIEDEKVANK